MRARSVASSCDESRTADARMATAMLPSHNEPGPIRAVQVDR